MFGYNEKSYEKMFKKAKKHLDFSIFFCYNIGVAWRDGRVGLRRTTGNRVYPNRYHGFESHSLRHNKNTPNMGCSCYLWRWECRIWTQREALWVRIHRPKIAELALQAQGACIFTDNARHFLLNTPFTNTPGFGVFLLFYGGESAGFETLNNPCVWHS